MILLVVILTVLANIALGVVAYKKNPHSATHQLLGILNFIIAVWTVANYLSIVNTQDINATLFWMRTVMFVTTPLGFILYLFTRTFPKPELKIKPSFLYAFIGITYGIALLSYTNYMFTEVSSVNGSIIPTPGPMIALYGALQVGFLSAAIAEIYKKFTQSKGVLRLQMKYLVVGLILTFSGLFTTNYLLVTLFQTSKFVVFGPTLTLIFVGSITYAIVKHRFLEIRALVVRSVLYTALVLLIGSIYTFALYVLGRLVLMEYLGELAPYASLMLVLFIVFSFQPLKDTLEKITNGIFYKDRYDPNKLLSKLGTISTSTLNLKQLVDMLVREILIQIKPTYATLIVLKNSSFYHLKQLGDEEGNIELEPHKVHELVVVAKEKTQDGVLVFDELEHESVVKRAMRDYLIQLVVPLVVKDEIVGVLLLGDKSSGEMYSVEDIEMFRILADGIAVAINNSLSYEEIVHFNETLEQKVDKATQNLQHANERLKELDRVKDEFVSIASHEMRTPLTVIRSYLWMMLQGKSGRVSPKQKMYLERAFTSADRLIDLVNDMLNVARIEAGRMSLIKVRNDVAQALRNVITGMGLRAQELSIDLKYIQKKRTLPKIEVDAEKLEQVVINLVGNSLKFTPAGGTITVSSDYDRDEEEIVVCVADTGIGISKEDLPKLFHKFSNPGGDYKTRTNMQSTGLGLYLSKQIVKMHGGRMWAESDGEGKGSRFYFSIPAK